MAPRGETPQGEHRRLIVRLRQAREARHLTQKEVADSLEWSTSKLIRIESGAVGISVTDLKALLLHYKVTDANEVDDMVDMARASKKAAWWQKYRDVLSQDFHTFIGLEASAARIKAVQVLAIPGLLQTREYIATLLNLGDNTPEKAQLGIDVRLKRQELISENGPECNFIIDESVLYRTVGDNVVMRGQLQKLKELVDHPRLSIQIMPFSAGIHRGMKNSYEILELSEDPGDYAMLLESSYKDELMKVPTDETSRYVELFARMEERALPATETPHIIDRRLKEIERS
jgi:transcriptional regulator with XRE-family HTH domain